MLDRLEQQKTLTLNQWKIIVTANLGDVLDFFDFYLIGYALAFILKEPGWKLTYGQSALILLSSGLGAVPGAFFWGWMADRIGRRRVFILSAITIAAATAVMALTPGPNALIPGWIFLSFFRFFVGVGNAGIYAVDLPMVQEFVPSYKRGWVSALTTTLLPAGSMLGAISGAYLAPVAGWRGLFLLGLAPIFLVLMVRYWVPESPRFLMRMGRNDEARKSLAWTLQCDPNEIDLPATPAVVEKTAWRELFNYPRSVIVGCLTGLTQTGTVGIALWLTTLFVMFLKISPAEASFLLIWYNLAAICGRVFVTAIIDVLGRRGTGVVMCSGAVITTVIAGYSANAYLGGVSVFFVMVLVQNFFASGNYALVGPYVAEIWPARLRASGMGLGYGVGNIGKFIGPLGLALIAGSSDYISPKATADAIGPAFLYFAAWWVIGGLVFWFLGMETKGRSIEDIDRGFKAADAAKASAD